MVSLLEIFQNGYGEFENLFYSSEVDYTQFATDLSKKLEEIGRRILVHWLESLDELLFKNPDLRKKYTVHKKAVPRELFTKFGLIKYQRRYYKHRDSGQFSYLLDQMVDLEAYERVDKLVSREIVRQATHHSYQKSSNNVTDNAVSKQTVMRKIRQTKGVR